MNDDNGVCDDIWEIIICGGYNPEIDDDIISVMQTIRDSTFIYVIDIADKLKLPNLYVELIQYMICTAGLADYGASPRGCWLTDKGKESLKRWERIDE